MPAGDRTGPGGMGPMSGKASGHCVEQQAPWYANTGCDSGMGRGFGRGRGRRFRGGSTGLSAAVPAETREQELEQLKRQAEYFKAAGEGISARIKEIETPIKGE